MRSMARLDVYFRYAKANVQERADRVAKAHVLPYLP